MPLEYHVFCCTNRRPDGHSTGCCASKGSEHLQAYFKARIKERGLEGAIRINKAGCLNHCAKGSVVVVYPEGQWYSVQTETDIDTLIEQHLVGGQVVERLAFTT
jgi:(2Fe-2S) ferredoxin